MKVRPTVAAPVLLIVVFALIVAAGAIPDGVLGFNDNPYLATVIIQLVIFALPALFFCTLRGSEYRRRLRLRVPPLSCILITVCATLLMITGSAVIEYFMSALAPDAVAATSASETAAFAMNSGLFDGLYLVLAFAVLPAVTEEFLFRGIIMTEYGSLGVICAVIMSSITFAMSHMSPVRLPEYLFCGIVLALLAYASRSIIASMAAHTLYNAVVIFFEDHVIRIAEKQNISSILFVIISAVLALTMAAVFAFEASGLYRGYGADNVPSDHLPKKPTGLPTALIASLLSPSFLLLTVMYIVIAVVRS